jgi:outer membrane protein, multidrug efflux system
VREDAFLVAESAARNSAIYARDRYRSGLIDFQTLLEAERSLLSSQDSRTTARAARATASVQLYKALGGGWSPDDISGTRP